MRAICELPPDYQHVLRLRQLEDCSFNDIGKKLGKTPEAARKIWARAIERLKEILNRIPLSR
jgi:RNA polymerase sigma-70 factor (ECF subfamily)